MFSIHRQIFDIEASDKEQAQRLQERIRLYFHLYLKDDLEDIFKQLDIKNKSIVLDFFELDLGYLREASLEEDLRKGIKNQLKDKLQSLINANNSHLLQIKNLEESLEEGLEYYLQYGSMPTSASREETPETIIVRLTETKEGALKELLNRNKNQSNIIRRLAAMEHIALIYKNLQPIYSGQIETFQNQIIRQYKRWLGNDFEKEAFSLKLKELILNYLLQGEIFERKSFFAFLENAFLQSEYADFAAGFEWTLNGLESKGAFYKPESAQPETSKIITLGQLRLLKKMPENWLKSISEEQFEVLLQEYSEQFEDFIRLLFVKIPALKNTASFRAAVVEYIFRFARPAAISPKHVLAFLLKKMEKRMVDISEIKKIFKSIPLDFQDITISTIDDVLKRTKDLTPENTRILKINFPFLKDLKPTKSAVRESNNTTEMPKQEVPSKKEQKSAPTQPELQSNNSEKATNTKIVIERPPVFIPVFIHFLKFGELNLQGTTPDSLLDLALEENQALLQQAILNVFKQPDSVKISFLKELLSKKIGENAQAKIIELIEPAFAGFIFTVRLSIEKLLEPQAVKLAWESIWEYFLHRGGQNFSMQNFLTEVLKYISKNLSLEPEKLKKEIKEIAVKEIEKGQNRYRAVVNQLDLPTSEQPKETNSEKAKPITTPLQILAQFLQQGKIVEGHSVAELRASMRTLIRSNPDKVFKLIQAYLPFQTARERLADFFEGDIFKDLIKSIAPENAETLTDLDNALHILYGNLTRAQILQYIFNYAQKGSFDVFHYLKHLVKQLAARRNESAVHILQNIENMMESVSFSKEWLLAVRYIRSQVKDISRPDIMPSSSEKNADKKSESTSYPIVYRPKQPLETVSVNNAGIVLIAPFLSHFFNVLEMLDRKRKFKSQEAAHRAVHLLQYIGSRQEQCPEYLLTLNKVLCGVSLEEPMLLQVEITETEKEWSEKLLQAAINQWAVLKNTSPDGLRGGYLIRDGLLSNKGDDKWLLRVEQKTWDMLLDKLPWSISLVKLPWMPGHLEVEWR